MQVIRELMRQPIDKSNAGLILYGLQLASNNLSRFRELYPPPPPEEEEESGPSLVQILLDRLREGPEPSASEPPNFEAPIAAPLTTENEVETQGLSTRSASVSRSSLEMTA